MFVVEIWEIKIFYFYVPHLFVQICIAIIRPKSGINSVFLAFVCQVGLDKKFVELTHAEPLCEQQNIKTNAYGET
jgi:hypothetical protein